MSQGKQLSYCKQQQLFRLNQKVPNPVLVSKWKGCPPLTTQTPAELDRLLKYPCLPQQSSKHCHLIIPIVHESLPGLAQGEYKVSADLALTVISPSPSHHVNHPHFQASKS